MHPALNKTCSTTLGVYIFIDINKERENKMKNVKFWLAQIAMVAIVSLVLGSPVLAGPDGDPSNGKRSGEQSDNANAKGADNSNSAAEGFEPVDGPTEPPTGGDTW